MNLNLRRNRPSFSPLRTGRSAKKGIPGPLEDKKGTQKIKLGGKENGQLKSFDQINRETITTGMAKESPRQLSFFPLIESLKSQTVAQTNPLGFQKDQSKSLFGNQSSEFLSTNEEELKKERKESKSSRKAKKTKNAQKEISEMILESDPLLGSPGMNSNSASMCLNDLLNACNQERPLTPTRQGAMPKNFEDLSHALLFKGQFLVTSVQFFSPYSFDVLQPSKLRVRTPQEPVAKTLYKVRNTPEALRIETEDEVSGLGSAQRPKFIWEKISQIVTSYIFEPVVGSREPLGFLEEVEELRLGEYCEAVIDCWEQFLTNDTYFFHLVMKNDNLAVFFNHESLEKPPEEFPENRLSFANLKEKIPDKSPQKVLETPCKNRLDFEKRVLEEHKSHMMEEKFKIQAPSRSRTPAKPTPSKKPVHLRAKAKAHLVTYHKNNLIRKYLETASIRYREIEAGGQANHEDEERHFQHLEVEGKHINLLINLLLCDSRFAGNMRVAAPFEFKNARRIIPDVVSQELLNKQDAFGEKITVKRKNSDKPMIDLPELESEGFRIFATYLGQSYHQLSFNGLLFPQAVARVIELLAMGFGSVQMNYKIHSIMEGLALEKESNE